VRCGDSEVQERTAATRFMSVPLLGRVLHVRATGGAASLALLRCGVVGRWAKLDLAWEFGSPGHAVGGAALQKQPAFFHSCGGAAAAAGGGGKAMRRLTDLDPSGC
jgi:hypothetical protein